MAITAASVRAAHPEFAAAPDAVINPAITAAYLAHDSTVWASLLDTGVDLWVCDYIARSPYSRDLRLTDKDGTTIYREQWTDLRDQVAHAYRVLP